MVLIPEDMINKYWTSRCNIYNFKYETDEYNMTSSSEDKLYSNIPCRISYKSFVSVSEGSNVPKYMQSVVLYIGISYVIPEGSQIEIDGIRYKCSGIPAKYSSHQEIEIKKVSAT